MSDVLDRILSQLDRVRGRAGNYTACCPAHKDRAPSFSIRETADGKILMHCHAGCSVDQIANALGVELSDLFPADDSVTGSRGERRRFSSTDLLRVIDFETTVVMVAANDLANGKTLPATDLERLRVAARRINEAMESSGVRR